MESWLWHMAWPTHWSGVWKKKKEWMIETRKSGVKGTCMGIWEQTQNLKNTVSHVNAYQKALNRRDTKQPSRRNDSQSVLAFVVPTQGWYRALTNIVAVVAKREATHEPPTTWTPTYQGRPRCC